MMKQIAVWMMVVGVGMVLVGCCGGKGACGGNSSCGSACGEEVMTEECVVVAADDASAPAASCSGDKAAPAACPMKAPAAPAAPAK